MDYGFAMAGGNSTYVPTTKEKKYYDGYDHAAYLMRKYKLSEMGAIHFERDAQDTKVAKVMREFENGNLKDSHGNIIKDKSQALAVAMSESGQSNKG